MAVKLEGSIKRYLGLSTDLKPSSTDEDKIPVGSSFLETDTGRIYRFDGYTWSVATEELTTRDLLAALLRETQRIATIIGLATGVEMPTHEGDGP